MTRSQDHTNNSNKQPQQPPFSSQQKAAVSEEAAIFNTFALIVRNKFVLGPSSSESQQQGKKQQGKQGQGQSSKDRQDAAQERINRLDDLYSNPEYNAEKKMLQRMNNNGMVYGLACGLLTFGLLRSGPRLMQRYLNRKLMHPKSSNSGGGSSSTYGNNTTVGGYTFDQPTSSGGSLGPSTTTRGGFFKSTTRGGIFLRTLKFGLDLTVSLFMAAYGSLVFVDRKKLMDDMSKIPLVEGRSLVSDELCDEFVDVYRRIPKHTWDKYEGKSDALDAIGGFVKNCIRREIVEKKILEKRRGFGMDVVQEEEEEEDSVKDEKEHGALMRHTQRPKRRHVTIPSPGVSPDIPVRIEWIDSQGGEDVIVGRERSYVLGGGGGGEDENGEDEYFGNFNENDDDFGNFDDFTSQEDGKDGSEKRQ